MCPLLLLISECGCGAEGIRSPQQPVCYAPSRYSGPIAICNCLGSEALEANSYGSEGVVYSSTADKMDRLLRLQRQEAPTSLKD